MTLKPKPKPKAKRHEGEFALQHIAMYPGCGSSEDSISLRHSLSFFLS